MILKNEDKNKLRKHLETEIKKVPNGERIQINKDILEELIFIKDFGYDNSGNKITFKYPVWTGSFLKNIDLSEISFNSVIWDYHIIENLYTTDRHLNHKFEIIECYDPSQKIEHKKDKVLIHSLCQTTNKTDLSIDLSNTNAKIDFSKAITLNPKENFLYLCKFDDVDLSDSHLEKCLIAKECSFKNTNIKTYNTNKNAIYESCNFKKCNFLDLTLSLEAFFTQFKNCNMSNTGIQLTGNIFNLTQQTNPYTKEQNPIAIEIKLKHLDNCQINGIQIRSEKEKSIRKKNAIKNYEKHVEQSMQKINEAIKVKIKTK